MRKGTHYLKEQDDNSRHDNPTNSNNDTKCTDNVTAREVLSITDDSGTTYVFKKPSFECNLKFIGEGGWIFGTIDKRTCFWTKSGTCRLIHLNSVTLGSAYNLAPLQRPWY